MSSTRRRFLAGSVASCCAMGASLGVSEEADETNARAEGPVPCLDYGLSFICNPAAHNAVRFWIESRTTLIDDGSGKRVEFYQCASCKSEHTFAEKNLFHEKGVP